MCHSLGATVVPLCFRMSSQTPPPLPPLSGPACVSGTLPPPFRCVRLRKSAGRERGLAAGLVYCSLWLWWCLVLLSATPNCQYSKIVRKNQLYTKACSSAPQKKGCVMYLLHQIATHSIDFSVSVVLVANKMAVYCSVSFVEHFRLFWKNNGKHTKLKGNLYFWKCVGKICKYCVSFPFSVF